MIEKFEHYRPTEKYEIAHALVATAIVSGIVALLIGLHTLLDFIHPTTVTVNEVGKIVSVVQDHWTLLRSLILKSAGALTGGMIAGWALLIFNHIVPVDYLGKIGENAIACAIFMGACAILCAYIWCFG